MSTNDQLRSAELLLRGWASDEDVERLVGVSLLDIIVIRAQAASASHPRIARPTDAVSGRAQRSGAAPDA